MDHRQFRELIYPYTCTSIERQNALLDALDFVRTNKISGDYVECGVWRGGNVYGIAKYLEEYNDLENNIWLYDTFEGMTAPSEFDWDCQNNFAGNMMDAVKCDAALELVQDLMNHTTYPNDKIRYVVGDICQTLDDPKNIPKKIALLRLDTDFYASTKKELEVLWDRLQVGAPCIIDDYGHWQGARKAVDEFFANKPHEFVRIDYTGILIYKKN